MNPSQIKLKIQHFWSREPPFKCSLATWGHLLDSTHVELLSSLKTLPDTSALGKKKLKRDLESKGIIREETMPPLNSWEDSQDKGILRKRRSCLCFRIARLSQHPTPLSCRPFLSSPPLLIFSVAEGEGTNKMNRIRNYSHINKAI